MSLKQSIQRRQGKVAEMFIIDGVELTTVNQILYVRDLDDRYPSVVQQDANSLDEVVQIGDMSKDIVCDHDVWKEPLLTQSGSQICSKELTHRSNSLGF